MRERIWRLINAEQGLTWFNWVIILLIFVSLALLAIETEPTIPTGPRTWTGAANMAILVVFALEYALRIWASGVDPRWRGVRGHAMYLTRAPLLADLLAFAPELAVILFFPGLAQEAMFLRALRLIRVARLFAYFPAMRRMLRAIRGVVPQLAAGLGIGLMVIFISACVLYFAEAAAQPEDFGSIPRALWWAVATLTTVGYGDAYPVTVLGKIAAGITALGGVGVVALPAGVLAGAFAAEFQTDKPDAG